MLALLLLIFGSPLIFLIIDLLFFVIKKRRIEDNLPKTRKMISRFILSFFSLIAVPLMFLLEFDEAKNDCCTESAVFSPDHKLSIYVLISLCLIAYFYSFFRKKIFSPVVEVLTNILLVTALVFNVFIAFQVEVFFAILGNVPIFILFIFQIAENHYFFLEKYKIRRIETANGLERLAWAILDLKPIQKIPLLFLLCVPILILIVCFLLLFGQKPDAFIRAFTDTYKHGFSQLNHQCQNVECGGHFLCSVAAKGHKNVVVPIRYGERHGGKIICNRQLLVANAFEENLEERLPKTHRFIRKKYNKVGNFIHKYYFIFENKYISDAIFILMKPLEWLFLMVLYTFEEQPENRIATQYLTVLDKQKIRKNGNKF